MRRERRHARAHPLRVRAAASRSAERAWRPLLVLAGLVFALSGPAHAAGRADAAYYGALAGLTLGALAIPLGLLGLVGQDHDPSS